MKLLQLWIPVLFVAAIVSTQAANAVVNQRDPTTGPKQTGKEFVPPGQAKKPKKQTGKEFVPPGQAKKPKGSGVVVLIDTSGMGDDGSGSGVELSDIILIKKSVKAAKELDLVKAEFDPKDIQELEGKDIKGKFILAENTIFKDMGSDSDESDDDS